MIAYKNTRKMARLDFSPRAECGGSLFALDEIHEQFNARRWQDTGEDALFYLSQHRRFGDDIACFTQKISERR